MREFLPHCCFFALFILCLKDDSSSNVLPLTLWGSGISFFVQKCILQVTSLPVTPWESGISFFALKAHSSCNQKKKNQRTQNLGCADNKYKNLNLASAFQRFEKRNLIRIFKLPACGQPVCDPCYLYPKRLQQP